MGPKMKTSCQSNGPSETCHPCELTLQAKDLKLCDNKCICVSDLRDCEADSSQYNPVSLNISCYLNDLCLLSYSWNPELVNCEDTTYSFILNFSTERHHCPGVLNGFANFNLTLRRRGRQLGDKGWFGPHLVDMVHAVKAPVPTITTVKSSDDSLSMSWTGDIGHEKCQVRYRVSTDHSWTQVPEDVPVNYGQSVDYVIKGLQPYTNYCVSLVCVGETGQPSEWSDEIPVMTLERAPSKGLEVCYHLRPPSSSSRHHHLILMWKALNMHEATGRILGYRVAYTSRTDGGGLSQNVTFNTTEMKTELNVWEQEGEVTVTAFNSAGSSPPSLLRIHPLPPQAMSTVRSLWVRSRGDFLVVQWDNSSLPVSGFAIEWTSHTNPESKHWRWVDGHSRSADLTEHILPLQTYTVSIYPIYHSLCGPPQSLPVGLEHGVHSKPDKLHIVVTGDVVTAGWEWVMDGSHIRVDGYRLELRHGRQEQVFPVWPDVRQHTFPKLQPHTTYSVHLLADNLTQNIITFTVVGYLEAIATATSLISLSLVLGLFAILYKTLYKDYILSQVANPQASQLGQWLLKPHTEEVVEKNILKLEDFLVTDLQVGRCFTEPDPESPCPSEEEDKSTCFILSLPRNESTGPAILLCCSGCEESFIGRLESSRVPSENSQIKSTLGCCPGCIQTWAPPRLVFTVGNTIECDNDYIVNTFAVQH
ncbi:interleukin-6 receptor subunit beta [Osmerus eperlanus]|uniref:interleukin-6 receptor subunit beta n=1 Tax=Osmerus eperlanus TaxID=29151 RepID=UPI002E10EDB1